MSRYLLSAILLILPLCATALDDPMRPPSAATGVRKSAAPERPEYQLTSTYIARERRVAVINGKSLKVGDAIGAAKVTEILPTQVRLTVGQKEVVLRLLPVNVKTPAQSEKRNNDEQG